MMATPPHVGTDLGSWDPSHAGQSPCLSWTWSCCRWWAGGPPRPPSASHSRAEQSFTHELEIGFENSTKSSPDANVDKVAQMQRKIMMCLGPSIFLTVQCSVQLCMNPYYLYTVSLHQVYRHVLSSEFELGRRKHAFCCK